MRISMADVGIGNRRANGHSDHAVILDNNPAKLRRRLQRRVWRWVQRWVRWRVRRWVRWRERRGMQRWKLLELPCFTTSSLLIKLVMDYHALRRSKIFRGF